MARFVGWIQSIALGLGAPGLFLAALADSSFLSLPEIDDIVLIWMVTQHKSRMLLYAAGATLGSVAGCLVLYDVGRKGDQSVMRRFSADRMERAIEAVSALRGDGSAHPVTAAAAGAVQDLRPAGRRRRHRAGRSPSRLPSAAASATSARRCWRVVRRPGDGVHPRATADGRHWRWRCSLAAGLAAYLLWPEAQAAWRL